MRKQQVLLWHPEAPKAEPKQFAFDRCYWSHDGYLRLDSGYLAADPEHPHGEHYVDQDKVYKELGRGVLENAWQGYNATLLAYGQTGSGKSYSMIGYGANTGIVPRLCEDLFRGIEARRSLEKYTQYEDNEAQMAQMKQSFEEKLRKAEALRKQDRQRLILEEEKKALPHLSNLNYDPLLSGKIVHLISKGVTTVGKGDADVSLHGAGIQEKHALLKRTEGEVTIERGSTESRVLLNGEPVTGPVVLNDNDRIMFGTSQLYLFVNPRHPQSQDRFTEITYEMAQEEIAIKAGIKMNEDDSIESALLNHDLIQVVPRIDEANAMSEELDKGVHFQVLLLSPQLLGKQLGRTEVYVKVRNTRNGQEFEWTKDKFLSRLFAMKEMYQNYDTGQDWDVEEERDPFLEDPNAEVRIGTVQVYLQPLAYLVDVREQLEIIDFKGEEVGILSIEIVPCSESGHEYTEDDNVFVDSPAELVGRDLHFVVKIVNCRALPQRFTDIRCRYRVFEDQEDNATEVISGTSDPDFNYKKYFSYKPVTTQLVEYLSDSYIAISVWGVQVSRASAIIRAKGKTLRKNFQADLISQTNALMNGFRINGRNVDPNKQSIIVELLLMKKQQARQNQKLENLRKLVESAESHHQKRVPVSIVKDLLLVSSAEAAEQLLSNLEGFEGAGRRGTSICTIS
ncbi:kinesin-like protein KIF28P [Ornithodoros turicata]|uniref:kinesin-like protein KIF28P n=1 Tax=Ornithodoros turicata TaxID=34597 RepID=UPI003139A8DE